MRVAILLFTQTTIDKLAAHAITPEEVRQVNDGDRVVIRNPRPRVEGSILMIGPTYGGRVLTIVLNRSTRPHGTFAPHGRRVPLRSAATIATGSGA